MTPLRVTRAALNALPEAEARRHLLDCCGSPAWAARVLARRPFASDAALLEAADAEWGALPPDEWLAAFRHHPRIGETSADAGQSDAARAQSAGEQEAVRHATPAVRATLADANLDYERRFGYIFIICAAGQRTEEVLEALTRRLGNDPETELRVAAEEQRRITRLRLRRLVGGAP